MKYVSNNKGRYLIEVSLRGSTGKGRGRGKRGKGARGGGGAADVGVPSHFEVVDTLSKCVRCRLPRQVELVGALEEAEAELALVREGVLLRCVEALSEHADTIAAAVEAAAHLDALCSLAHASRGAGRDMCRPQIVDRPHAGGAVLRVRDMYHPFLRVSDNAADVIANSFELGGDTPPAMLLTGPNMGGKSTLLRQACIAVLMAQIGCFVPAAECTLSPVDRIFTRVGAHDDIFSGRSTFMVELQETAAILRYATPHSLVILDELGRGTSTFDGTAIAHAVLEHLARLSCRLMFATHYHLLVSHWERSPLVQMAHMACLVEHRALSPHVTFLYQAVQGVCPESYGVNVARMSGIPESVMRAATEKAQEFQAERTQGDADPAPPPRSLPAVERVLGIVRAGVRRYPELFSVWADLQ
eukprot:TRINITY_DN5270_c0_g1_i1.p2 TRINITY_DN5270_c0_g1~~TRINITY_DN5270_c0_g1_i1.p2  ORF type:complete len:415 (+),score=124.64 TRINITY_DN5270_c0_g1_i1:171-1415(+)